MNPNTERLRKKYMEHPPEGMTSEDIRRMSEDDLLDMDYFLNEDDPFDDDFGEEGFYILSENNCSDMRDAELLHLPFP